MPTHFIALLSAAFLLFLIPVLATAGEQPLSPAEFNYMQRSYNACNDSTNKLFYDCGCVSAHHLDLARQLDQSLERMADDKMERALEWSQLKGDLQRKSYDQCANIASVAMMNYERCVDQTIAQRADYREFCQCYAVRYADRFGANGNMPFFNSAEARAQAIATCNAAPPVLTLQRPDNIPNTALPSAFK